MQYKTWRPLFFPSFNDARVQLFLFPFLQPLRLPLGQVPAHRERGIRQKDALLVTCRTRAHTRALYALAPYLSSFPLSAAASFAAKNPLALSRMVG